MASGFPIVNTVGQIFTATISAAQSYFDSFKTSVTDGFNASNGLKDGGKVNNNNLIPEISIQAECSDLFYFGRNQLGSYNAIQAGSTTNQLWYSATPATIVANTAVEVTECYIEPPIGRMYEIDQVDIHVTGDCFVFLVVETNIRNTIATAGRIALTGLIDQTHKWMKDSTGGTLTWRYGTEKPLIVRYGERVKMYYYRNSTTGINMSISVSGKSLTNDTNYNADKIFLGLGDSIIAGTVNQYAAQNGLFTYAVRNLMLKDGKKVRFINKGVGGTTAIHWGWMARQGMLDNLKCDLCLINLGMNDIDYSAAGLNGPFKNALKDIARVIKTTNPRSPIVFNNISPTDSTGKQTYLAQYRAELVSTVSELVAEGIEAVLADVSNAFPANSTTAFISSEAVGSHVHPNSEVGQPLMTPIIYNAIKTTSFYN